MLVFAKQETDPDVDLFGLTGKLDNETEKSRENISFISAFGLGYANIKSGYGLRWIVILAMRWVFNSVD